MCQCFYFGRILAAVRGGESIYLYYNENLRQIKVWSDFDLNNPPTNVFKDDTASYVYEFTEE